MRRPSLTRLAAVIASALLVVLALAAPAGAGGRNDLYSGPIEQAPLHGFPHEPRIEIFAWTQHHHDGRVTRFISAINIYDVHLRCENGSYVGGGEPIGNTDLIQINSDSGMDIEGGSFNEPRGYGAYGENERIAIKGKVSKRAASGTIVISNDLGWVETEELPGEPRNEHFGTCRSGRLSWTATLNG
jgi:hypothetical protein